MIGPYLAETTNRNVNIDRTDSLTNAVFYRNVLYEQVLQLGPMKSNCEDSSFGIGKPHF